MVPGYWNPSMMTENYQNVYGTVLEIRTLYKTVILTADYEVWVIFLFGGQENPYKQVLLY